MDYLEIVLQGYFNENNKEHLEKYFFREFKKAEKEQFFEANEFFNGCLKVVERWEKYLQDKINERKKELYLAINAAKSGTLKFENLHGQSIEQKRKETIEYCEQELKEVRPDGIGSISFTVHLASLTNGRIAYSMGHNELLLIKHSINKAYEKAVENNKKLLISKMDKTVTKISNLVADFYFFQIDLVDNLEYKGKTYKEQKQRNNNSILTPENWEQHKETFFTQRMATYKDSYTLTEKIKLELSALEKLSINKTDYQILIDRYKAYLRQKQDLIPQQSDKQKPVLKIDQIALKYVYEGYQITRENGNELAKKYGHNSGEKLFQRFTYYSSSSNRKGKPTPCTPKKLDNKIKLIESVIDLLPKDKKGRAKDEVEILKSIYESEYQ